MRVIQTKSNSDYGLIQSIDLFIYLKVDNFKEEKTGALSNSV